MDDDLRCGFHCLLVVVLVVVVVVVLVLVLVLVQVQVQVQVQVLVLVGGTALASLGALEMRTSPPASRGSWCARIRLGGTWWIVPP